MIVAFLPWCLPNRITTSCPTEKRVMRISLVRVTWCSSVADAVTLFGKMFPQEFRLRPGVEENLDAADVDAIRQLDAVEAGERRFGRGGRGGYGGSCATPGRGPPER